VLQASAKCTRTFSGFLFADSPGEENQAEFLEENGDEYLGLQNSLMHLFTELQAIPKKPDEGYAMSRPVDELRMQLGFILEAQERNIVF
jgi:hypothetical protein